MHSSDQTDQPPEPKKKKSTLIILLGDDFESDRSSGTNSTCTSSVKDLVQSEVLRYKSEPSIPLEGKAYIEMVGKNEHLYYPNLAIMACKYQPHQCHQGSRLVLLETLLTTKEVPNSLKMLTNYFCIITYQNFIFNMNVRGMMIEFFFYIKINVFFLY